MDYSGIAQAISKYAPALASVVGAINPLAGVFVNLIASKFGTLSTNPSEIVNQITSDPDAALKLKQIELEHVQLLSQDFKTEVDDRESARTREIEVVKATGRKDIVMDSIAVMVVAGFFGLCILNYFADLTDDHVILMLLGQISSGFMLVLSYFFGSSKSK